MANRIQLRRDGAQQWANINPILAQGELGIEIDTSRIKIGDGVTPWNSLKYERPLETESNAANTLVKRDADGNFQAGAITATLIGNAATATRLANARQIQLTGQITGSGSFDGSANLSLNTDLSLITTLPHYDPANPGAEALYTRVRVNSQGRVTGAELASTLSDYGITDAQPLDADLTSIADLQTLGILVRSGQGNVVTRQLTGGAGRIIFTVPDGSTQNPFIDLADTTVVVGDYNTEQLTSVGTGSETVNATKFTVDRYGRLTAALTVPIATATEGTKVADYDAGTAYVRYDIIKNASKVYQAIADIPAGSGAPSHTTGDNGDWRYLGAEETEQKGLASFAQEDFDVDNNGHVTIAAAGVDNTQMQNNRISFADGNTKEDFELDQELTSTTGYRGFNYLNYVKVNDTSGNLLFGANNTGDSGAGEIDVNVRSYFSDPDITLDGAVDQILDKTGDGNLTFQLTQNSNDTRTLSILSTNAGAGFGRMLIQSQDRIDINTTDVNGKVWVEDYRVQENYLGTTNAVMHLDPGDDRATSGTVRIHGDLQIDGTTTTVNSTTVTVDDPIIVLGGDTAPTSDDGLDRGVEFSYYDSQARVGFYGWDESVTRLDGGTGGFAFLYNATNTGEVFSGTDAYLKAGALSLTTNTGSTSTTTGTLVVTGGTGISERLYVGGRVFFDSETHVYDNLSLRADNKQFLVTTAGSLVKFSVDSDNGNTITYGTLTAWGQTQVDDNVIFKQTSTESGKTFVIKNDTVDKFTVDYTTGNTHTDGTLDVDSGTTLNSTLDVDGATTLNDTLDVDLGATFHDSILMDTTGKTFTITNGVANKFQVSSTNGNTDIEGTLNVAQFVYLEDNDEPTISTDANDNFIISGGDYGAFRFDGGGYIEGDTLFNSDIYINGAINQKDQGTGTETFSTQNYLRVRYKFRTGTSVAYTPDYATHGNSNLRVYGGGGIATDLHIGEDLFVGKKNSGDNVEFQVLGATGNTTIGRVGQGTNTVGTLDVHGDARLYRNFTVNGNVTIGSANTDTLTVNSVTTFTDNATVNGNLTVDGNTLVEGNLTVNGTTTTVNSTTMQLDDPVLTLGGDTAPTQADAKDRGVEFRYYDSQARVGFFGWDNSASRYALYHNATNSSEAFSGTRSGLDAGSVKLFDTTNATSASTGALIVGGGAGIGMDLYVGDDLVVTDDTSIGGNLSVTGTFDLTNNFTLNTNKFTVAAATGNTQVAGTFGSTGAATLSSTLGVSGNTTVGGTLGVTGATTLSSTLAVTSGTTLSSTLDVTGASNVNNTLGVTGVTTITNASTATTSGQYTGDGALRVTGGASIGQNLVVANDLKVYGDAIYNGDINYAGTQTYSGKARFNNTTDASSATSNNVSLFTAGGLAVSKKAYIGDDLDVGGGNFTVDGPTGNTAVAGTFGVTGGSNFSTITASGVADLQSTLTLGGNLAINTNKFVVNSATGNTTVAGSLNVAGATVIDDTLNVTGATDLDSTLNVDGAATFNSTITQNGTSTFNDSVVIKGSSKLLELKNGNNSTKITLNSTSGLIDHTGNLNTGGNAAITGNTTIGGTLGVTGQITGNVTGDVTGTATNADNIDVTNTNNNTTFYPMFASANTGHTGVFVDSANLTYNPFSNTLSVTNFVSTTNFEVQGNLNVTGNILYAQSQVGSIANHTTSDLTEGTNLYFTDERVDDRVAALIDAGTGISASYDDAGNLLTLSAVPADINTDNLTEGSTNVFFTATRARNSFSAGGDLSYDSATGQFSVTTFSGAYADLTGTPTLGTAAAAATTDFATAAQGTLADNALPASDVSTFGGTLIDDADAAAARTTLGLGTAATTASSDYATAAQGTQADTNDTDIDDLYAALNAIGNDAGITNVAGLKAALAALTR